MLIKGAAARTHDVPQLMLNTLAWLPQLQRLLGGMVGCKEKKRRKKTGCGFAVVMATEARYVEPPQPVTV